MCVFGDYAVNKQEKDVLSQNMALKLETVKANECLQTF